MLVVLEEPREDKRSFDLHLSGGFVETQHVELVEALLERDQTIDLVVGSLDALTRVELLISHHQVFLLLVD